MKFRSNFTIDTNIKVNWFPGHMNRIYNDLPNYMNKIDVLLEVRDCRNPISSGNPELLKYMHPGIKRIILFNKFDLCDKKKTEAIIKNNFKSNESLILSAKSQGNVRKILEKISQEKKEFNLIGVWCMVIGIPNVGKSSIINVLRTVGNEMSKTKLTYGSKIGDLPTTTRHIDYFKISSNPNIFIMDSPGVMPPKINRYNLDFLKLSASRNISSHIVEKQWICDYILFNLNISKQDKYVSALKLDSKSDNINEVISQIKEKFLKQNDNDAYDLIIKKFNDGELGNLTFDEENIKELVIRKNISKI